MHEPLLSEAHAAIEAGELAGAVALVGRSGEVVQAEVVGTLDAAGQRPMGRDALFRIASLTKPVTACAALLLHEDGRFALDDPIATVAPELATMRVLPHPEAPLDRAEPARTPLTFRHLLTHTAGLPYADLVTGPVADAYAGLGPHIDNPLSPDAWLARLGELPLVSPPGEAFGYGHASDVLGILLARLEGERLGRVLRRRIFEPLGMVDTGFTVDPADRARRVELCGFDADGERVALQQAPGGHALAERPASYTFTSGGQGLWSTADDYHRFVWGLLRGLASDRGLLRTETTRQMLGNQLTAEQLASARLMGACPFVGHGFGMGLAVVVDPERADPVRGRGGVGTVGWPGAYGGWWQADPDDDSVLIFLCHAMAGPEQLAEGVGLGAWAAALGFRERGLEVLAR